jgi:hypothetical protein
MKRGVETKKKSAEKKGQPSVAQEWRRFGLQEAHPIDPIPMRPPGYFSDAYTKEDVEELNCLAKSTSFRHRPT